MAELEDDKAELEQQLETGFKPNKISKLKEVNLQKHKQMMEEKAKRERDEMRRQMLVGVDFLGQKEDMKILSSEGKANQCLVCLTKFKNCINYFIPLSKAVKKIGVSSTFALILSRVNMTSPLKDSSCSTGT